MGGKRSSQIRRKFTQPTPKPVAKATTSPRSAVFGSEPIVFSASVPDRVMHAGIDRSTLPGPNVITSICPSPTIAAKAPKDKAAYASSPAPRPEVNISVMTKANPAAAHAQTQGLMVMLQPPYAKTAGAPSKQGSRSRPVHRSASLATA